MESKHCLPFLVLLAACGGPVESLDSADPVFPGREGADASQDPDDEAPFGGASDGGRDAGARDGGRVDAGGGDGGQVAAGAALELQGERFSIGGVTRFVLGASYFSCLYAPAATLQSDFQYLHGKGVSVVRCWVNWPIHHQTWDTESPDNIVLVRADGTLSPLGLTRLEQVLSIAQAHGLVVDATFNQDTPHKTFSAHKAGIVAATSALKARTNLLFDLQNETSHYTNLPYFMSPAQVKEARDAVKAVDPARIVTASVTSVSALSSFVSTGDLDVGAYHCCRSTNWEGRTYTEALGARAAIGPGIPVYFQEPNRCGTGGQYADCTDGSEFVTAATNAKRGHAAGWVFHNEESYDLRSGTLQGKLNAGQHDALNRFAAALAVTPW